MVALSLWDALKSPGGLLKQMLLCPTPRIPDLVGLGNSSRICISNNLPADAGAAGSGFTDLGNDLGSSLLVNVSFFVE